MPSPAGLPNRLSFALRWVCGLLLLMGLVLVLCEYIARWPSQAQVQMRLRQAHQILAQDSIRRAQEMRIWHRSDSAIVELTQRYYTSRQCALHHYYRDSLLENRYRAGYLALPEL